MANFTFATAGAALGSALGFGSNVGWLGGHLVSRLFNKNKSHHIEGKRLQDLSVQTSTYGRPIPIVYGQAIIGCNIIWSSGIKESSTSQKKRLDQGTKIVETSYSYSTNLALGLCAGPIEGVLRIWANDVLIYDRSVHNAGSIKLYPPPIRLYDGSENQIPDPLIQSIEGINNVPAFKNLAYLVLEDFPLHDFKNKMPHFQVEIISKAQEITKTKTLDLISEDFDNICISKTSPYLYLRDGNLIQKVHRFNEHVVCSKNLTDELPRTDLVASSLFGQMCLDHESNTLYAFVQNQLSSFIVCINTLDLSITRHNFNERIIGDESIGFIDNNHFYSADFLKGHIRVYDKRSLERHDYVVPGCLNSGLHQRPGNFTKDTDGNIWLVSHDPMNQKNFYLTKFQYGIEPVSTKIKHYGYATHIAFDHKTQRFVVNSSEGLLKLHPKTFEIEAKIRFKNSIGNAHSSFLNHPILLNGLMWSFNDRTAFLINLIDFKVEKKISFSTLNIQAFGLSFDAELNCLWSKGKGLHKTLLNRFDSSSCGLNEVVADVLRRGGIDDTFHNCDLNQEQILGYVIAEPQSIYRALQPLISAYFFHLRSQAHKISFFHPDKQKIIKIDPNDLGAHEIDAYTQHEDLILLKQPADQLPENIICHYASYERFYENSCQEVHKGGNKETHKICHLSLPLLLTDAKAQQIAEKTLALSWMHGIECIFSLPPAYIYLEPGDLVEILHHERVYQLMIVNIDMGANYLLEIKAVLHHMSAYESALTGVSEPLIIPKMIFPPEIIAENQDQ